MLPTSKGTKWTFGSTEALLDAPDRTQASVLSLDRLLGRLGRRSPWRWVNHRKRQAEMLNESFFPEIMAFISLKLLTDFYREG